MKLVTTARAVAAAATLGALMAAASTPALAQGQPFRIVVPEQTTPLVINSVITLAVERGYFADAGVDVQLVRVNDTPTAIDVLGAGDAEMANVSTDGALSAILNQAIDARAVISPDRFLPYQIESKEAIGSVADLAGKSFGVGSIGSLDYTLTNLALTNLGVDPTTVNWVPIGAPAQRAETLANGDIDATTTSVGVWLSLPSTTGLHVILSPGDYGAAAPIVQKVNLVTAQTLADRRDDVVKVVTVLLQVARDYAANPDHWVADMHQSLPDQDQGVLTQLSTALAGNWSVNGGLSAAALSESEDSIFAGPNYTGMTAPALDAWVDFSVVDDALAAIGASDAANNDPTDRCGATGDQPAHCAAM